MRSPKVIALYRTDRGRFSLDEDGSWQPSIKATLCTAKQEGLSVAYPCGLMNSELLDLWFAIRGKNPRDVWRNYEPKAMKRIPYRHIALGAAADLAAPIEELTNDTARATALADTVRRIATNRQALLPHRQAAPLLRRVVKDPWNTGPVIVDAAAMRDELAQSALVSVRLDGLLTLTGIEDGPVGRATQTASDRLSFVYRRKPTVAVAGDEQRVALLKEILGTRTMTRAELNAILLPKDAAAFVGRLVDRGHEITKLLVEGRDLVERAERLTCRLFGVPEELEDEVVARAISRATVPPTDEDE